MDDLAIGRLFRELRIRLSWPQRTVAARAGISTSAYSDIERGRLEGVPIGKLRRVGATLEVRLVLDARWRGGAVDRLLSSRHSSMTEAVGQLLTERGWEIRPEVSFNRYGERGVVDIVAWHAASQSLLLVELKTELADVGGLLAVMDRRRRLAATIAEPFDWRPLKVALWVVVAESRTNRRRLAAVRVAVRAAFPADGHAIAGWLSQPRGAISALSFLADASPSGVSQRRAPQLRVRTGRRSVAALAKAV